MDKRNRFISLLAVLLVLSLGALMLPQGEVLAQPPQYWAKTYGGTDGDGAVSVQQTVDGGYIVAGWTHSFGAGSDDCWVLKLASNGDVDWQKTYGGTDEGMTFSVQQTADGGYIVAGYTFSFGAGGADFWVLKLDEGGSIPECPLGVDSDATVTTPTPTVKDETPVVANSGATIETPDFLIDDTDCSTDTQCYYSPPPPAVGGEAYPVNKPSLLAPWIALAVAIIASTAILTRRRRAGA